MEIAKGRIPEKIWSILSAQIDAKLLESQEYKLDKLLFFTGNRKSPPAAPVRPKKRARKLKSLMAKMSVLRKKQQEINSEIGKLWSQTQSACQCAEEDFEFDIDSPEDTLGNRSRGDHYTVKCKLCQRSLAEYYEPARYYR